MSRSRAASHGPGIWPKKPSQRPYSTSHPARTAVSASSANQIHPVPRRTLPSAALHRPSAVASEHRWHSHYGLLVPNSVLGLEIPLIVQKRVAVSPPALSGSHSTFVKQPVHQEGKERLGHFSIRINEEGKSLLLQTRYLELLVGKYERQSSNPIAFLSH